MNKSEMLRYVNMPLALSFLIQTGTALIMISDVKLPNKDLLFGIHEYNGLLLITLAVAHIYLNWGWIRATFLSSKKRPSQAS